LLPDDAERGSVDAEADIVIQATNGHVADRNFAEAVTVIAIFGSQGFASLSNTTTIGRRSEPGCASVSVKTQSGCCGSAEASAVHAEAASKTLQIIAAAR
jgi:hypothetical protein